MVPISLKGSVFCQRYFRTHLRSIMINTAGHEHYGPDIWLAGEPRTIEPWCVSAFLCPTHTELASDLSHMRYTQVAHE